MIVQCIPATPEDLTCEWLTDTLKRAGAISAAAVRSFDVAAVGQGSGFTSRVVRIKLQYDPEDDAAPPSLIGKFHAPQEDRQTSRHRYRLHEREIAFYRRISKPTTLRMPRAYCASINGRKNAGVLLLEDIAGAWVGTDADGCSDERAELAIHTLAGFHAEWWNRPRLDDLRWLPLVNDNAAILLTAYRRAWGKLSRELGGRWPRPIHELGSQLETSIVPLLNALAARPRTIVHGDYRLPNLLFGPADRDAALTVIDWQLSMRSCGLFDVAWFLMHLPAQQRRRTEERLLKLYHSRLVDGGVPAYSFDRCEIDYRLCLLQSLFMISMIAGSLRGADGYDVAVNTLDRCAVLLGDHEFGGLLTP